MRFTCRGQIWRKSAVAKLPKSHIVLLTKNFGVGDTFEPPFWPPLNRSRPKFREHCRPLTCACVPTLVRIGCGFPDLFRKESKKVKGFQLTITLTYTDMSLLIKQELSYRKQIARQLRTQYVEGIHRPKYYTVTLKSRLRVTQGHWKGNHWTDHTRPTRFAFHSNYGRICSHFGDIQRQRMA